MIAGIRLHIEIGDAIIQRCPRLQINSVRHRPLDVAVVDIPDARAEAAQIFFPGDPVRIEYGYRGGESAVWEGTLRGIKRISRDQVSLLVDGKALPLTTTFVRDCYADESSVAIASHLLGHTGLSVARIDIPNEAISRFPVSDIPVWQAVRQLLQTLRQAYGHDMDRAALWLGATGLNLGDFDEAGNVPVIATGENLIRHLPAQASHSHHSVESALLPGMAHSRLFRLIDMRLGVDEMLRALSVRHEVTPDEITTKIQFGRERG
tara:strand:- start:499 stop:1290 length:792 start_codon:yes stop_codon:yes gene_type:complete